MPRIVCPAQGIDYSYEYPETLARKSQLVRVISRTDYLFTGSTSVVNLANGIDSRDWVSAVLVVRVYSVVASWPVGGSVGVYAFNMFIGQDDPATTLSNNTPTAIATFGAVTPPVVITQSLSVIGPMLSIVLFASQTGTSTLSFTIAVDLVGRTI